MMVEPVVIIVGLIHNALDCTDLPKGCLFTFPFAFFPLCYAMLYNCLVFSVLHSHETRQLTEETKFVPTCSCLFLWIAIHLQETDQGR